ncbi:MAG: YkgJ family cysteine cluster protein [Desulfobacterales bacterium]
MVGNQKTIPAEDFVRGVYGSVDAAIARQLTRLRSEAGIVSNCQSGCCHCCRYLILINSAEARTLAQYVKREMSADQISGLRLRTRQWHAWNDSGPGRYLSVTIGNPTDFSNYTHCCPLLVDGRCSAYPARPMVCRAHFVSSDPLLCRAANDPQSAEEAPVVLSSVVAAVSRFSMAIKDRIEKAGLAPQQCHAKNGSDKTFPYEFSSPANDRIQREKPGWLIIYSIKRGRHS